MRLAVVLSFFIIVVHGWFPKDVIQELRENVTTVMECLHETGASEDDIMPLVELNIPETEKGKCYVACLHKKNGIMNKDGKIDKVAVFDMLVELKLLDEDTYKLLKPIVDKCIVEAKNLENECETATNILKCLFKEGNCGPTRDTSKKCALTLNY